MENTDIFHWLVTKLELKRMKRSWWNWACHRPARWYELCAKPVNTKQIWILTTALLVKKELEAMGAKSLLTEQETSVSLVERAEISNKIRNAFMRCIHFWLVWRW